jgi:hypothetical protein
MKLLETGRYQLLSLFITIVLVLTMHSTKAQAETDGNLEVDVPFQFHAGNVKLPPGKYTIHMVENTDQSVMEISSVDGSTSALFEVERTQSSSGPAKSELIFNKYGNRYFLAKVFDEANPSGRQVLESRYEKRISEAAAAGQEHVPARHPGQQGN